MRARTLLIILILIAVIGLGAVYALTQLGLFSRGGVVASTTNVVSADTGVDAGTINSQTDGEGQEEPGLPAPTPTPIVRYADVVVAVVDIPIGQRISEDLVMVTQRSEENIAVQAGVTFDTVDLVVGQIAKARIAAGQEVLSPMLAVNASDLAGFGSDLSLYVDQGKVAVAFPIDRYSGMAYAMRPGDLVDVLMSLRMVEIDPELKTALPNHLQVVDQQALSEGEEFLFPSTTQGRLELIPEVNLVAQILPKQSEAGGQFPKRVTQLAIQQAEVVWIGTWVRPDGSLLFGPGIAPGAFYADPATAAQPQPTAQDATDPELAGGEAEAPADASAASTETNEPSDIVEAAKERNERIPDLVILSMPAQEALSLQWAMIRGIDIDLALRAQGDTSVFFTTSVSLPQLVEQGGLTPPETDDFDLYPRIEDVPLEELAPVNPNYPLN